MNNKYILGGVVGIAVLGGVLMLSQRAGESQPSDTTTKKMDERSSDTAMMAEKELGTIVEVAVENGSFTTLVTAVQAAGLVETLSSEGPFTVFAPTDDAFAKLPEGTVEALLEDPEKLAEILTYHVVSGKVMAADVAGISSAPTVQGQDLTISTDGESVKINDSTVIIADVEANNGVIHVIDTVLLPE